MGVGLREAPTMTRTKVVPVSELWVVLHPAHRDCEQARRPDCGGSIPPRDSRGSTSESVELLSERASGGCSFEISLRLGHSRMARVRSV